MGEARGSFLTALYMAVGKSYFLYEKPIHLCLQQGQRSISEFGVIHNLVSRAAWPTRSI